MLRLRGREPIAQPAPFLMVRLGHAGWLAAALPDTAVVEAGPDRAVVRSRLRGPIPGEVESVADVTARDDLTVRYVVRSRGVGGSGVLEAELRLEPHGLDRTLIHWEATLTEVGGLLKLAPTAVLRSAAEGVVPKVWDEVGRRVAAEATT